MPGAPDPLYVAARRVLLDALEAIKDQLHALVLVGAQAVYLHAGEPDLAVAPYTTDGDLAIDPDRLNPSPLLEVALAQAGFSIMRDAVGIWQTSVDVAGVPTTIGVDLLVPESVGGGGRRAARIPPHGKEVARKVVGLEGALVDKDRRVIAALDPTDKRQIGLFVAGPAALVVAKTFKIMERQGDVDRRTDKDALDLYRLVRAVTTGDLASRFDVLRGDHRSRQVTATALEQLPVLFGRPNSPGCLMAARAAQPLEDSDILAASLVALTDDLLLALR